MTNRTELPPTVDDVLVKLQAELAELETRRTQAQREVNTCVSRMNVLAQRIGTIRVAITTLVGLPPLAPEQTWLDNLNRWRPILCDELLALPSRIRDPPAMGVKRNLELSIITIDRGLPHDCGYDLITLRLGQLMREAGYEPSGADPDRNYRGVMPWFGSMPQVKRRIQQLTKQRDEAQAALDEALLDDTGRERLAAEATAHRNALNAMPQRKTRRDGSQYDKYPDGRRVEVTESG